MVGDPLKPRNFKADQIQVSSVPSRFSAFLVIVVAVVLYSVLPGYLLLGPRLLVPGLEVVLAIALVALRPDRRLAEEVHVRAVAISLIALINLANTASVVLLVRAIVTGSSTITGKTLIYSAAEIWATNILVFGLWFWEVDRGGPGKRSTQRERDPDFLFPQMTSPKLLSKTWTPSMIDYVYVALTNATAFSPTDTMPLSPVAKTLMTAESLVSMVTITMVAARAVNILH